MGVSHALKIQTQILSLDLHTSLSVCAMSGILALMAVHAWPVKWGSTRQLWGRVLAHHVLSFQPLYRQVQSQRSIASAMPGGRDLKQTNAVPVIKTHTRVHRDSRHVLRVQCIQSLVMDKSYVNALLILKIQICSHPPIYQATHLENVLAVKVDRSRRL